MEITAFLSRCNSYCDRTGMSPARLSTILFGSGVTIGRLEGGKGVTVRVLERATVRLAERERSLEQTAQPSAA